jgi:hypothetical protein
VHATPLHHKPIVYGSPLADGIFFAAVVLHVLPATVAPVSAIVALATRKGGRVHVAAGRLFVWSMTAIALTGIAIDVVRLTLRYHANHTKYAGFSMPSTIPARIAFLFAGIVVLWALSGATPPRVFDRKVSRERPWLVPSLLLALGFSLAAFILVRLSPWNGSLWMIGTFSAFVVYEARARMREPTRAAGVARHRAGMTFLGAFSWWGALQGFGPAIAIAVRGPDLSTAPYVGDRPGPYANYFVFFVIGWAPIFAFAAFLVRRFRLRAAART